MSNKRIVHQVTRRYMLQNKKRTLTTLFGIVFMVMLMTCVFVGKDTAVNYLEELASQSKGKWHMSVYDVTKEELGEIEKLDDVEQVALSAQYDYTSFQQSENIDKPYLHIKAYEKTTFDWMNIKVVEGRLPENEGEIVINIQAVKDGANIKIGDTIAVNAFKRYIGKDVDNEASTTFPYYGITLHPGDRIEAPQNFPYFYDTDGDFYEEHEETGFQGKYEIVGFIETPGYESDGSAAYTAICLLWEAADAEEALNVSIRFDLNNDGEYYRALEDIVGEDKLIESNDMLVAFSANTGDSTINGIVTLMTIFFVVLIIAASVILIYNVFNISFDERSKYLGMLSSVGATGKQKRSSVYYEAFTMLMVALPVGFVTGLLVVKLGMKAIKPYMEKLLGAYSAVSLDKVSLEISLVGVIFTVVFSVLTVWISAYLPARKIGKIGPIECIRGNAVRGKRKHPINKIGIKLFGASGMLAANSIARDKKKTRGIVGAAAVFMIILIVTAFSAKTLTSMITHIMVDDGMINNKIEYDYGISSGIGAGTEDQYETLKVQLEADENVENVVEYYDSMYMGRVDADVLGDEYWTANDKIMDAYGLTAAEKEEHIGYSQEYGVDISVIGFDDATLEKIVQATGADKSIMYDETKAPVIVVQSGELSTQEMIYGEEADFKLYEIEHMTDLSIGESFEIGIYNPNKGEYGEYEQYPVTIAGYATNDSLEDYMVFHSNMLWVITNVETMEEISAIAMDEGISGTSVNRMLLVKFKNQECSMYNALGDMALNSMDGNSKSSPYVFSSAMLNTKTISEAINSVIEILLICFVALTSVICLLNLYNSTKGRITGQKKEYAILRSVGMTDKQMRKMLALECVQILVRGVIIAVAVATPVIVFIRGKLVELFGYVNLPLPWDVYVLAVIITVVALLAISFISFRTEKNQNILEDIRREGV